MKQDFWSNRVLLTKNAFTVSENWFWFLQPHICYQGWHPLSQKEWSVVINKPGVAEYVRRTVAVETVIFEDFMEIQYQ